MSLKRIDAGRGHRYMIDGKPVPGVTSLIGDGMPKPALVNWAANVTAGYAVDHWDELADQSVSRRLEVLKKARWSDLDQAARRGTEVHGIAERLAHGEEVEVPDEIAGHVESAVKFLDDWRPEILATEIVIGSRKWNYCGTADLIGRLPDGRVFCGDWKTSRSGIFAEAAMQVAAYANADVYLDDDGNEQPIERFGITTGLGIWIRADGYDVYELDLEPAFKVFQHVAWLARQCKDLKARVVSEALPVPTWEAVA